MKQSKKDKQIDALIQQVYRRTQSGRQIDIMWITTIFKDARAAYLAAEAAAADREAAVAAAIAETIARLSK